MFRTTFFQSPKRAQLIEHNPEHSESSPSTWGCAAVVLVAAICVVACKGSDGCHSDKDCKGDRVCQAGECVEPLIPTKLTGAAAGASSDPARPGAVAYPAHNVAAGTDANGTWTPAFTIRRDEGEAGLAYLAAYNQCAAQGLGLCTETQWSRACAQDPALGAAETWTASPSGGDGFVMRGGSTCTARRVAAAREGSSARGVACCDRAVGIRTANTNESFLVTSAKRTLDYENALRRRDTASLSKLYDDNVQFIGKDFSRDALITESGKYFRQFPDQWILYDTCETRIDKGAEVTLVSDCTAVSHRKGELAVVVQHFVRGGPQTAIQLLTEPRILRKFSPP
jgi:hypothetical protein